MVEGGRRRRLRGSDYVSNRANERRRSDFTIDKLNATVSPSSNTTVTQLMYVETLKSDYLEEEYSAPGLSADIRPQPSQ